jgi:hypothetical protein
LQLAVTTGDDALKALSLETKRELNYYNQLKTSEIEAMLKMTCEHHLQFFRQGLKYLDSAISEMQVNASL